MESTGANQFSKVLGFVHRDSRLVTNMLTLRTLGNRSISLSHDHIIPFFDQRFVPATELQKIFESSYRPAKFARVGHWLLIRSDRGEIEFDQIIEKKEERKIGIFAPITKLGNIFVNDILASCYSGFDNGFIQRNVFQTFHALTAHSEWIANWVYPDLNRSDLDNNNTNIEIPLLFQVLLKIGDLMSFTQT